jgi:hypothetical protein
VLDCFGSLLAPCPTVPCMPCHTDWVWWGELSQHQAARGLLYAILQGQTHNQYKHSSPGLRQAIGTCRQCALQIMKSSHAPTPGAITCAS